MDKLSRVMTKIRRVTEEDIPLLVKMAKADDHEVVFPTHAVERSNQLLGYLSVGNIPTVLVWLDTHRANIRDSMAVMNFYENTISDRGGTTVIIPCSQKSPFRPYIEQVGYLNMNVGMFIKQL